MKWSKVRVRLKAHLAESLRGRVDFHAATYAHGTSMRRTWITVDGDVLTTVARDFLRCTHVDGLPPESDLGEALDRYLDVPFARNLASPNQFIRGVAMLDARLGKRRLRALDVRDEAPFVRLLHQVRCRAEDLLTPALPQTVTIGRPRERRAVQRHRERLQKRADRAGWEAVRGRLAARRREENIPGLLASLRRQGTPREALRGATALLLHDALNESGHPDHLAAALAGLAKKTRILDSPRRARGALAFFRLKPRWLRPWENWTPSARDGARQFSELARHLFAGHPVPAFLDNAWLDGDAAQQEWFLRVGSTGGLRGAPGLPLPLTRRMAACFLEAPDHYPVPAALRFAQVRALGGGRRVADGLLGTPLAREFEDDAFWSSVIRFFIENPMLDTAQYGPIVDFIRRRRAEQPRFSMNRRSREGLLRDVERWHRDTRRDAGALELEWKPSGIPGLGDPEPEGSAKSWRTRELLNGGELAKEGEALKHCVASYAGSCRAGTCSIWALELRTQTGLDKRLTVEIDNATRVVRQARGRLNRLPNPDEMAALRRWASLAELRMDDWLLG